MWARLSAAITAIQNRNISKLSYEEHYRYAYNLVLNQQGGMLYSGVRWQVDDHLSRQCAEQLVPVFPLDIATVQSVGVAVKAKRDESTPGLAQILGLLPDRGEQQGTVLATIPASERFLAALTRMWNDHCSSMGKLRDVLKYVDRVYVVAQAELSIWDMGLELMRDAVVHSKRVPVHENLMASLLRQIYCERQGTSIERGQIKSVCDMLITLPSGAMSSSVSVYKSDFEPLLLATSADYYVAEAQRLLATRQSSYYLQETERRLAEEESRVHAYLSAGTHAAMRQVVERHLLTDQLTAILAMPGSGLVPMLEGGRDDQLQRLYRLFCIVPAGLPALNRALREYATQQGKAINSAALGGGADDAAPSADAAAAWVNEVLQLKKRFDEVLHVSFDGDKSCETAFNEAFDSFINMNPRAAEFISLFIDECLKRGAKMRSDEEVDAMLDTTISVFRFVHEKDVFERYYKLHLTRRLLHGRSVSDDAERGMIAKLKVECGHGYVQKLQGMLNDMKLSQDVQGAFHTACRRAELPFEMNVNVLTATYWPIAAPEQRVRFPPQMTHACEAFERFYYARHRGRVLTWQASLGSADVRVRFNARTHELVVSTYALVVLLLFERVRDDEPLAYEHIQSVTQIAPTELQRVLQSLACAKYKVLRKEPRGRDVSAGDHFFFNADFTCPLARVKIAQVAAKVETRAERRETTAKVEDERKNQVEACIVRVMKNRKTLAHNELVNEVIRQLLPRFQPSPALIKKRIESLLDRGTSPRARTRPRTDTHARAPTDTQNTSRCVPRDRRRLTMQRAETRNVYQYVA